MIFFFFSSRRRHTRLQGDWSSDVCSSDLADHPGARRPRFMVLRRTCVYEDAKDWRVPAEIAVEDLRVFNGLFYNAAGVVNGFPTPMDLMTPARAATPLGPEALRDN